MDWRGFVILVIGIGVPIGLLLQRCERELFALLCITVGVNMLDVRVGLNKIKHADSWRLGRGAFIVMASTHLVQANPLSPIWSIFVGLGLGAGALSYRPVSLWSRARSIAIGGAR